MTNNNYQITDIKSAPVFDQPVILERRAVWASVFVWVIIGMTTAGVAWAAWAKVEQVIPANGKLEPKGSVVEVKVPTGGVVQQIHVKGGDIVKKDQLLLSLNATAPEADVESLREQRESALKQKKELEDDSDIQSLKKLRSVLVGENESYTAEVTGQNIAGGGEFSANQQRRLQASRAESDSRVAAAQLQVQELEKQLNQVLEQIPKTEGQVEIARGQLETAQEQIPIARQQFETTQGQLPRAEEQLERAREQLQNSKNALALNEEILAPLGPLVREGAIAELQYKRQEQEVLRTKTEVSSREQEIGRSQADILTRRQEVSRAENEVKAREAEVLARQNELVTRQSEVARLKGEAQRLRVQIDQATQQAKNASAVTQEDPYTKIADNQKRIAEIDVQINRAMLDKQRALTENQNRLAQIDGQLSRAQLQLQYQELRAPVEGAVFDLKPKSPGFVVRETDPEPILKIVPNAELEASVLIQNKDIALVAEALRKAKERGEEGVLADINIEAFPSMEFGIIEGLVTSIGSDALPPTQEHPFYAFPATIKLNSQKFALDNNLEIRLQSGMAVQATVKIGKRTVLQIFFNRLTNKVKSLETVK